MTDSYKTHNPSGYEDYRSETPTGKAPRRKLWIWRALIFVMPLLVLIGSVGGLMAMSALKPQPEEKEDVIKAIPVLTATATQDDVTLTVNVQGEVQPRTEISLVPQVGGLITYMSPKFIEGGRFNKGDLLVRVDPVEYELRVTQAQANVAQADTVLAREQSESIIARQDWDELGRDGSPTPLTLRPFSGRVTMRHVDQGEYVTAGTKLGEIYAVNVMDVRLPLTNEELRRAGLTLGFEANGRVAGIPVTLSADVAGTYAEWEGQIVRTDSRFDATTRVLYAYAEVSDPFGAGASNGTPLAPGIFVNAAIDGQKLDNMTIVPRSALRGDDKVYVSDGETLSIKTVSVMSSDRNQAVLSEGLAPGAQVITSPIRGVADGMKIEVVKPGDTRATSSAIEGGE